MMKTNSLCFRLTLMTGTILLLCSIVLTLSASYNARKQLTAVAVATPSEHSITLAPGQVPLDGGGVPILTPAAGVANVTTARRNFDLAGLTALIVISVFGTGAVYLATRRALRPIRELNEQIAAITENNLDERVSGGERTDEVGVLCRSFNVMLERLSASFSAQKRFSANVAHELKTPLATMQAGVQVMRLDTAPTPEEYGKLLDTIERNTERLRAIIDDLMRLCDEQEQFEEEQIDLPELFEGIVSELSTQLREKQLRYEIDCGECPVVMGNPGLLYRAFFNLVENAIKYNRTGGSILISSSCEGNIGEIHIKDTGIGISADELALVFEPFYRVNKSRSRRTGGAGLGLSVVKTIIERHGWSISVSSTPDIGTEFIIRLYKS